MTDVSYFFDEINLLCLKFSTSCWSASEYLKREIGDCSTHESMRGNIETIEFCGRGNLIESGTVARPNIVGGGVCVWCPKSRESGEEWRVPKKVYGTAQSHEVDPPILFCQLGLKLNLPMWVMYTTHQYVS